MSDRGGEHEEDAGDDERVGEGVVFTESAHDADNVAEHAGDEEEGPSFHGKKGDERCERINRR